MAATNKTKAELRQDLDRWLKQLREEIDTDDNSDYDELVPAREALNAALRLLGREPIEEGIY